MARFLNRLLALPIDDQNVLFAALELRIAAKVAEAVEGGGYEQGVETVRADSFTLESREAVFVHDVSGAATVLTPEGGDFNDDLAALGPPALAVRLAPLLGPGPWAIFPAAPCTHRRATSAIIGPCASSTPKGRCARTTATAGAVAWRFRGAESRGAWQVHNRSMRFFNTEGPVRPDDGDRWRGRLAIPRCGIAGALAGP